MDRKAFFARLGVRPALAYLTAEAQPLVNHFTAGRLDVQLEEPAWVPGTTLMPGRRIPKDPTVVVDSTVDSWVFVRVHQSDPQTWAELGIEYGYDDGIKFVAGPLPAWNPVPGAADVWYQEVPAAPGAVRLPVFTMVNVPDLLVGEHLDAAAQNQITVLAWAVQKEGFTSPQEAASQLGIGYQ